MAVSPRSFFYHLLHTLVISYWNVYMNLYVIEECVQVLLCSIATNKAQYLSEQKRNFCKVHVLFLKLASSLEWVLTVF